MKIKAFRECRINGIEIKPGEKDYAQIDHKDKLTAAQLNILKGTGAINFNEIVEPVTMKEYIEEQKKKEALPTGKERTKWLKEQADLKAKAKAQQEKDKKEAIAQLEERRRIIAEKQAKRDKGKPEAKEDVSGTEKTGRKSK